jgi:hypothetical protein
MGAAQAIGWILNIDDTDLNSKLASISANVTSVQDAFGDTLQDSIQPLVSILEEIREIGDDILETVQPLADMDTWRDIAKSIGSVNSDVTEMTEAVTEATETVSKKTDVANVSFWEKVGKFIGNELQGVRRLIFDFVNAVIDVAKIGAFILDVVKNIGLGLFAALSVVRMIVGPVLSAAVKGVVGAIKIVDRVVSAAVFGTLKLGYKVLDGLFSAGVGTTAKFVEWFTKTLVGGAAEIVSSVIQLTLAGARMAVKVIAATAKRLAIETFLVITSLTLDTLKTATKAIFILGKLAAFAVKQALKPVFLVFNLVQKGLMRALGPVFSIIEDVINAIMFALEPLFMAFRLMIIPFVHLLLPIILSAVVDGMVFLIKGAKWLWDNVLKDVINWTMGASPYKSWGDWWKEMVGGWNVLWKDSGLEALWLYISDGKGISGWWANMKGGWDVLWIDSGLQAFFNWFSDPEGIGKWWTQFKAGWAVIWNDFGLKAVYDWITNPTFWSNWWKQMKVGWEVLSEGMRTMMDWVLGNEPFKPWSHWWGQMKKGWEALKELMMSGLKAVVRILLVPVNMIKTVFGFIIKQAGSALKEMGFALANVRGMGGGGGIADKLVNVGIDLESTGFNIGEPIKLAAGGEVRKPTLAILGEAGPELVIPLGGSGASSPSASAGEGGVQRFAGGGANVADKFLMLMENIRDILQGISDNTADSDWVNDPDFEGDQNQGIWES